MNALFSYCTCLLDLYPTYRNQGSVYSISSSIFFHTIIARSTLGWEKMTSSKSLDQNLRDKCKVIVFILQFGRIMVTFSLLTGNFYITYYLLSMVRLILILTQYQLVVSTQYQLDVYLICLNLSKTKQKQELSITILQYIYFLEG